MAEGTTRQIAEYSRILSQLLSDVLEQNFLKEHAKGSLSKTQFTILKILPVSGHFTVSEIADILNISRAAASKDIDKLVRSKLVNRKITLKDRRAMEVTLTGQGHSIVANYEKVRLDKQNHALAHFTGEEKNRFLELLKVFVQNCVLQEKNIDLICLQCNGAIGSECSFPADEQRCRFYNKIYNKNTTNEEED